ncbi:hypothetical protein [Streptacidiphilus sp. EB129]|uniref:hypothetical protein n=1 Tax=Streptacidiphilus sp. EB129 TaxID=3156262 RepID=UPI003515C386
MMTATKTAKKIQLLQVLIDHPRTGDEEREAGRRMLARLLAKAKENGEIIANDPKARWADYLTCGPKYTQGAGLTLTDIAKLIRQDIKLARKIGLKAAKNGALAVPDPIADAPAQIKFSVTREYYSGGGSIDIRIKNLPADWGWAQLPDPNRPGELRERATPALEALAVELHAIHWAYNYDGSDITTDLFIRRYAGGVEAETPKGWFSHV